MFIDNYKLVNMFHSNFYRQFKKLVENVVHSMFTISSSYFVCFPWIIFIAVVVFCRLPFLIEHLVFKTLF